MKIKVFLFLTILVLTGCSNTVSSNNNDNTKFENARMVFNLYQYHTDLDNLQDNIRDLEHYVNNLGDYAAYEDFDNVKFDKYKTNFDELDKKLAELRKNGDKLASIYKDNANFTEKDKNNIIDQYKALGDLMILVNREYTYLQEYVDGRDKMYFNDYLEDSNEFAGTVIDYDKKKNDIFDNLSSRFEK